MVWALINTVKFFLLSLIIFSVVLIPATSGGSDNQTALFPPQNDEHHYIKIEWNSPGITVNPSNISFNLDSPAITWEKIDICIYNPTNYHIIKASITLTQPENFDFKANPDPESIFMFEPKKNRYTVENFGNYQKNATCDLFEIKPNYEVSPGKHTIHFSYELEYKQRVSELLTQGNKSANSTPDERIYSTSHEENLSILVTKTEKKSANLIQEYSWILAFGSLICAVLLLTFGPGSKVRIEKISTVIYKYLWRKPPQK